MIPNNRDNPFLISSQSDHDSSIKSLSSGISSFSISQRSEPTRKEPVIMDKMKRPVSNFKYDDVCSFRDYVQTKSHQYIYSKFQQFINEVSKNILFFFGPTGCGKTIMVKSALESNGIHYEDIDEYIKKQNHLQIQEGEQTLEDILKLVERQLKVNTLFSKVYIFKDFPISWQDRGEDWALRLKRFKQTVFEKIKNFKAANKLLFILNTQNFNPYHILKEHSRECCLSNLANISVIKLEGYKKADMKDIIHRFIGAFPTYSQVTGQKGRQFANEIIEQASGDARKALQIVYRQRLRQASSSLPSSLKKVDHYDHHFYQQKDTQVNKPKKSTKFTMFSLPKTQNHQFKQEQKFNLFHSLGKFLYGKRLNPNFNPHKKKGTNNKISDYYNEDEINKLNLKFYFDPIDLFEKMPLSLDKFSELLLQNFLERYGKIKDIRDMYEIFRKTDSYCPFIDRYSTFQDGKEQIKKVLLTFGILICNRNSIKESKQLNKIVGSKLNHFQRIVKKKKQILQSHYLKFKVSKEQEGKRMLSDIIFIGNCIKRVDSGLGFYFQKLKQIICDMNYSIMFVNNNQEHVNSLSFDQEIVEKQSSRLDVISAELIEKQKFTTYILEYEILYDDDDSDIDMEQESPKC